MERENVRIPCIIFNTNATEVTRNFYKFCEKICDVVICSNLREASAIGWAKTFYLELSNASSIGAAFETSKTAEDREFIEMVHQLGKNPYEVAFSKEIYTKEPIHGSSICECGHCKIEAFIQSMLASQGKAAETWRKFQHNFIFSHQQVAELIRELSVKLPY